MNCIEAIDRNFARVSIEGLEFIFRNVNDPPFSVHTSVTVSNTEAQFRRAPEISGVNGGVNWLSSNTAGIKVRFSTDSPYIAIYAEIGDACHMAHMPLTGSCGFDIYRLEGNEEKFVKALIPPTGICHGKTHYHAVAKIAENKTDLTSYTIYFPLYNNVKKLEIGLSPDAALEKGAPFSKDAPIVYYGSSITQGGCASRPGNAYPALVTHKTNIDHINLGFSGACVAEPEMADYINTLDMCAFVFDYDYNAPSSEYLKDTHEPFFKKIRNGSPSLPIIIISAPFDGKVSDDHTRRDIIKATYDHAIADGDKNVYFIDGSTVFSGDFSDCCTVDGIHPNDLGFCRMAQKILHILQKIL